MLNIYDITNVKFGIPAIEPKIRRQKAFSDVSEFIEKLNINDNDYSNEKKILESTRTEELINKKKMEDIFINKCIVNNYEDSKIKRFKSDSNEMQKKFELPTIKKIKTF